jgi:hypothetical protein
LLLLWLALQVLGLCLHRSLLERLLNDKQVESKIVSTTDFANVGAALNDDSVKDARSGDWVKITGIFNIITKSNPTATTDFISLNAITTWESITGKPSEITDSQVTSGVVLW